MLKLSNADELNNLTYEKVNSELETFFNLMPINSQRKKKRVDIGNEIYDAMLFFFSLYENYSSINYKNPLFLQDSLREEFEKIITNYGEMDDYLDSYVITVTNEILSKTQEHYIKKTNIDEASENASLQSDYYLSDDRALNIAKNEANSIINYFDYAEAKKAGCTKKKWITVGDEKVRFSHNEKESEEIGIDNYFYFDDCVMLFPHDTDNGSMKQLANCRCSIQYSK